MYFYLTLFVPIRNFMRIWLFTGSGKKVRIRKVPETSLRIPNNSYRNRTLLISEKKSKYVKNKTTNPPRTERRMPQNGRRKYASQSTITILASHCQGGLAKPKYGSMWCAADLWRRKWREGAPQRPAGRPPPSPGTAAPPSGCSSSPPSHPP